MKSYFHESMKLLRQRNCFGLVSVKQLKAPLENCFIEVEVK